MTNGRPNLSPTVLLVAVCTALALAACTSAGQVAESGSSTAANPVATSPTPPTPAVTTATRQPAWPPPAFPMPSAAEVAAYTEQQRAAARQAAAQAQHVQAQRSWDILLALAPADAEAQAGHAQASAALRASAAERVARARVAQAQGDTESALRNYLEALALEPDNTAAAGALRTLEHHRAQRNHPLSFARAPVMPGGAVEETPADKRTKSTGPKTQAVTDPSPKSRQTSAKPVGGELEHAALLAAQGELEAAIALLKPLLQPAATLSAGAKDPAVRTNLADYHFMLAQRLARSDPKAARGALAQCLRLVPQHSAALALRAKLGEG